MERMIQSLSRKVDYCTNILQSRTCRLNADVLSVVFSYIVTDMPLGSLWDVSTLESHTGEHWKLANVCRLWRMVALSSPCLWNSVNIRIDAAEVDTHKLARILFFLNLQLQRSRSVELDVSLSIRPKQTSSSQPIDAATHEQYQPD